ncbi:MAG: CpXC domain-containing protein [Oscillospiraceae bacterium]|nr:CpXC domain-containing protein [Oscillospiraceae bacterium]
MSLNTKQSVRCPQCGQMSDITVWDSITVKDSPDLKADLLAGKANIFHCPSCSYTALMPNPLLYHDEEKRLMISFSPCGDGADAQRLFTDICETSRKSGELKQFEGYNLRFISDYNELLEKILIFDNDMNDKAVEVIKLMILTQEPEKVQNRICRFGKAENGNIEFMVQDREEGQIYTSNVPIETYNIIWTQLRETGVKPYSFNWEMVNADYAARLLNGFNN